MAVPPSHVSDTICVYMHPEFLSAFCPQNNLQFFSLFSLSPALCGSPTNPYFLRTDSYQPAEPWRHLASSVPFLFLLYPFRNSHDLLHTLTCCLGWDGWARSLRSPELGIQRVRITPSGGAMRGKSCFHCLPQMREGRWIPVSPVHGGKTTPSLAGLPTLALDLEALIIHTHWRWCSLQLLLFGEVHPRRRSSIRCMRRVDGEV